MTDFYFVYLVNYNIPLRDTNCTTNLFSSTVKSRLTHSLFCREGECFHCLRAVLCLYCSSFHVGCCRWSADVQKIDCLLRFIHQISQRWMDLCFESWLLKVSEFLNFHLKLVNFTACNFIKSGLNMYIVTNSYLM